MASKPRALFILLFRASLADLRRAARLLAADDGESWADLVSRYDAVEGELAEWQSVYDELYAEAQAIDARRAELQAEIAEYQTRIGLIDNDIASLGETIADLQAHIADLEGQRAALSDQSAALARGDALDEVQLNAELQQQLIDERDEAQAELDRRNADLLDLQSQRQGLTDFIGSADEEFQSLKPDLEGAWQDVNDVWRILRAKTNEMNRLDDAMWKQV